MSNVTDLILTGFCTEDNHVGIVKVNEYLSGLGLAEGQLHQVDIYGRNSKVMQCRIWIGAFNYLYVDELIDFIKTTKEFWDEPTSLQLMIKGEDTDRFRVINIFEE